MLLCLHLELLQDGNSNLRICGITPWGGLLGREELISADPGTGNLEWREARYVQKADSMKHMSVAGAILLCSPSDWICCILRMRMI